jgi:hypothetical protein
MEAVEPRCFKSVSAWSDPSVTTFNGDYFGEVLFGDNGNPWGVPTGVTGQGDEWNDWSFTNWDTNLDDGLDSDWRDVSLSINASGNGESSWEDGDEDPETFSAGTSSTIQSVTIQAAVAGNGLEMDWAGLTIRFYHNGALVETVNPTDGVSANTMNSSNGSPAESIMVVNPTATNANGVFISGMVRLKAGAGTYPGQTDIFGSITINAH